MSEIGLCIHHKNTLQKIQADLIINWALITLYFGLVFLGCILEIHHEKVSREMISIFEIISLHILR
jgi:hypothetical protein